MGASNGLALRLADLTEADPLAVEPGEFSELVGAIYDCALAPERWPGVLRDCASFIGAWSASLIGKGRGGSQSAMFYHDNAMAPDFVAAYFTRYAPLDPSTGGHLMAPIDTPISTADILDLDEFYETRFYREWAAPQGLVDSIMVPLERSANWAAMFALLLHKSSAPVEICKQRAALLIPHIRRAALIGKVVEQRSIEATGLKEAFDGLAAGMFLVDAEGLLIHANAAGRRMLEGADVLSSRRGRLVAASARATDELAALFAAAAAGDAALGTGGIAVPLEDRDGEHYVAHVLPLTGGRRHGTHAAAVAALFLRRASFEVTEPPEAMAKAFGLTLSELRVLMSIVHVGGVPETAEALGVAETTVKTHLHRVFAKTGTSRQAELVKLVAGFAGPLAK
ncbi:MAG: helix-turn-helix transcriptional regulator [Hyphomicrobiales bacterium]|nr:MAG: helix-turn-helix transcriptional regulator [Hyphomicrobiales bacterium]